jgi:hypothetical protein
MKILYWLEPFLELRYPYVMGHWLIWFARIDSCLQSSLPGYEAKLIAFDTLLDHQCNNFSGRSIFFSQKEMRLDWTLPDQLEIAINQAKANEHQIKKWKNMLVDRLNGFSPDVVFCLSEPQFLRQVFSRAIFLNIEISWLHHPPYPQHWQLDPIGHGKGRFLENYKEIILANVNFSAIDYQFIVDVKKSVQNKLGNNKIVYDYISKKRDKWKRISLFPLADRTLDGRTPVFAIIDYWLDKSDSRTFYLITQHSFVQSINEREQVYLKNRYKNIDFINSNQGINTQCVFPYVDEVIGDFTTAALESLFFDIPVISMAHEIPYKTPQFFYRCPLARFLSQADYEQKNKLLYLLLTHFSLSEKQIFNSVWIADFLQRLLLCHQNNRLHELFNQPAVSVKDWYRSGWLDTPVDFGYCNWFKKQRWNCQSLKSMGDLWSSKPSLNILIVVTGEKQEELLEKSIKSLKDQTIDMWILTVVVPIGFEKSSLDEQVIWVETDLGGNAKSLLAGIDIDSKNDWIMICEPGTCFEPVFCNLIGEFINRNPEWRFIYTDEDNIEWRFIYTDEDNIDDQGNV